MIFERNSINIFFLDKNLKKCAHYHCDKHVIKMILESAQILCSVLWQNGVQAPYRKTHANHPCTVWAGESLSNWRCLKNLAKELNEEYKYRFNKQTSHKSFEVIMALPEPDIYDRGLTPMPLAMPKIYYDVDPVKAYRSYYINEKAHIAKWTKRKPPKWFIRGLAEN